MTLDQDFFCTFLMLLCFSFRYLSTFQYKACKYTYGSEWDGMNYYRTGYMGCFKLFMFNSANGSGGDDDAKHFSSTAIIRFRPSFPVLCLHSKFRTGKATSRSLVFFATHTVTAAPNSYSLPAKWEYYKPPVCTCTLPSELVLLLHSLSKFLCCNTFCLLHGWSRSCWSPLLVLQHDLLELNE